VGQTRAAAGASFVQDSQAVSQAYQEASMQEAVAMQQYRWRALQGRASVQAMNQEGRSIDRIVNDYARQEGDYMTLMAINQKLRARQYTREQAAQVAQYLSRWNSQQFYEEQPYIDPIAPFAPLPTLLTPPPPSMTGSGPSAGAAVLNIGKEVLGGINTAMSMSNQLRSLKTPSASTGPGTPQG
jgi:DNA segregation ATPase FtsK/SpoIIIE-like protein